MANSPRESPSDTASMASVPPLDTDVPAQCRERTPQPTCPGYEIMTELGRGGMGVVYMARQISLGRIVALKMLRAGELADDADVARFRTEAESVARLQHPGIVQIFEVGAHNGLPYFSLEFVEGGSLDKRVNGNPLPPNVAARLTALLAQAMHAAHEKGILHRDLKPANIFLSPVMEGGVPIGERSRNSPAGGSFLPKIGDFGLAKKLGQASDSAEKPVADGSQLTVTGAIIGTPSYMAPEQARGNNKAISPATDIYALGAVLYELLTGRPPFRAATTLETLQQVIGDDPVPPRRLNARTPRDLETICLKCLRKEPAKRYVSAAALAEDLERTQNGEPILARPVGATERTLKWARRRPALASLAVLAVLLLVSASFAGVSMRRSAEAEKRRRQERVDTVATHRQAAELDEQLAQSEARAGRWNVAHDVAAKAATRLEFYLEGEPELQDLHDRLTDLQDRMGRLVNFYGNFDEVQFAAAHEDIDRTHTSDDFEAIQATTRVLEALGIFSQPSWWEHLPDRDLTDSHRERLREDVHEMLLFLAGMHLIIAAENLFTISGRAEAAFREARSAAMLARQFRNSQAAFAIEACCRLGLGESPPAVPEMDPGPVTAGDYFINGLVHLGFSYVDESHLLRVVSPLVSSIQMKEFDLKNPLARAQTSLLMAARIDPSHYWTHMWLAVTLRKLGRLREAELACNTCVGLRPDYALGYLERGRALLKQAVMSPNAETREPLVARGLADLATSLRVPTETNYADRAGEVRP